MKKLFLILCLFIAFSANAQFTVAPYLGVGNYSGLGYSTPTYYVGATFKYKLESFVPYADVNWSPNAKKNEEYGWSSTSYVGVKYYLDIPLFLDACVGHSYTKAPVWSKNSFRPCAGGGLYYLFPNKVRVEGSIKHVFKGTDTVNELQGEVYNLEVLLPKNFYFTLEGGVYRFLDSNNHSIDYNRSTYGVRVGKVF